MIRIIFRKFYANNFSLPLTKFSIEGLRIRADILKINSLMKYNT